MMQLVMNHRGNGCERVGSELIQAAPLGGEKGGEGEGETRKGFHLVASLSVRSEGNFPSVHLNAQK